MTQSELREDGYRWVRPTWERTGDRSWVLIVPSRYLKEDETFEAADTLQERCRRLYEVFEFDGSWFDQLHEGQLERILRNPGWRRQYAQCAN